MSVFKNFKNFKNWWIGRENPQVTETVELGYKIMLIEPTQVPSYKEDTLLITDKSMDTLELKSGDLVTGIIKGRGELEFFIAKRVGRSKKNQWYLIHSKSRVRSRIDDFKLIAQ
tara:strand:+ start:326 stop:667 length:342 start_codon:yes stop_codon:yes gene_type:complete